MLCLALLILAACSDNLFGNSSPNKDDSVKSLRIEAENAFRKGNYKKSYEICEMIVEKDPTSSFGYFGMAKASLWRHEINPLTMFSIVRAEKDQCPFMGADVRVQNNYLQAMKKVVPVLSELDRRDSLTAIYELYIQAKKDGKGLDERLSAFGSTFCGNAQNCRDTINKHEPFPLSDREYKNSYFGGILLLSYFSRWFLGFFDTSNNDCLARKSGEPGKDYPGDTIVSEWEKWGCKKGDFSSDLPIKVICPRDEYGNMNVIIDSRQVLEDLQKGLYDYYDCLETCKKADCNCKMSNEITDEIKSLNETIDNFSGDANGEFKELEDFINNFVSVEVDSLGEIDQTGLKSEIDRYKAYASFYKVGTHIDEDGDGCIDEDLLDGQDNDGDGLPNANSRLASIDVSSQYYGFNTINNSMRGNNPYGYRENEKYNKPVRLRAPVRIYNDSEYSTYTELEPDSTGFVTVIGFTQEDYPDGSKYWTSRDMDLKLAIAQDTACPPKYSLSERVRQVGGCWPYYRDNGDEKECKFIKYWLRRELATPEEQKKRVHPSCKNYMKIDCPP